MPPSPKKVLGQGSEPQAPPPPRNDDSNQPPPQQVFGRQRGTQFAS